VQQCVDEGRQQAEEEEANQRMPAEALEVALELEQKCAEKEADDLLEQSSLSLERVPDKIMATNLEQLAGGAHLKLPGAQQMPVAGTKPAATLASALSEEADSGPLTDHVGLLCTPVEEAPDWGCPVQPYQVTSPHLLRMYNGREVGWATASADCA